MDRHNPIDTSMKKNEIEIVVCGETIKVKNLTPLKAIKFRCVDCSGGSYKEVKECPCYEDNGSIEKCPLWLYRFGKRPKEKPELTPIKAIRKYCLWCCCGGYKEVKECPVKDCSLYEYRMGKNPKRKLNLSSKMPVLSKKCIVERQVFLENFSEIDKTK